MTPSKKRRDPGHLTIALKWWEEREAAGFFPQADPIILLPEELDPEGIFWYRRGWVTVEVAAKILGESEKSILNRIHRWPLIARKEPIPGGFRWRILLGIPNSWERRENGWYVKIFSLGDPYEKGSLGETERDGKRRGR